MDNEEFETESNKLVQAYLNEAKKLKAFPIDSPEFAAQFRIARAAFDKANAFIIPNYKIRNPMNYPQYLLKNSKGLIVFFIAIIAFALYCLFTDKPGSGI